MGRCRPLGVANASLRTVGVLGRDMVLDPRTQLGPAWVSWAYAPGYVSWCPLGWNNHAVLSFGFSFGYDPWRAWTVVPHGHFGHGYVHANYVEWARVRRAHACRVRAAPCRARMARLRRTALHHTDLRDRDCPATHGRIDRLHESRLQRVACWSDRTTSDGRGTEKQSD
jgi:hypothetical protein